ncbi:hypothetical protein E4U17_007401 [Claviceps sp. LM77 group G4]|nr:hypothetical protein E4U17_007401 [Claviceps sp. LM77 group G4]KAG6064772.1 hypothetical protein E4U33_006036 [Claviceps sp. LM78 group G4]KAG6070084.1 hypothetical protein E4U16_007169 [Claviceps sp. LM84 group G4]
MTVDASMDHNAVFDFRIDYHPVRLHPQSKPITFKTEISSLSHHLSPINNRANIPESSFPSPPRNAIPDSPRHKYHAPTIPQQQREFQHEENTNLSQGGLNSSA